MIDCQSVLSGWSCETTLTTQENILRTQGLNYTATVATHYLTCPVMKSNVISEVL